MTTLPPAQPYRVIRPRSGWQPIKIAEIWRFRDLLLALASRDLKLRYRQTLLGALWVILQPLLAAAIFALVFGHVANLPSEGRPYFLFSYAGLLGWNAFSNTLTRTSVSLVQNSHLISKACFPRLLLPLSAALSTLVDSAVAFALMAALMMAYGVRPSPAILLLPLWLAVTLLLGLGVGLWASALAVSYRDVQHVLPVLTQIVLYASPVAYALSVVPEGLRPFFLVNPLSGLLEAFRWSLLGTTAFDGREVSYSVAFAVVGSFVGAFFFTRAERTFADVI